jgi:threonine dehydrogenase-like Zn-dependent dehydrogenase
MCPDRVLVGFTAPGLLAEYAAVPAAYAWPVPGRWSDGDAVCAEPLTVALAAIRRSGIKPGGSCLVVGAGSAGRPPGSTPGWWSGISWRCGAR